MRELRVRGENFEVPFSRWILANSLVKAGIKFSVAYELAEDIRREIEKEKNWVTSDEILDVTYKKLSKINREIAERYIIWHRLKNKREPLIVLIGGASGVGTSTVALEVAKRLGVTNVIGTDIVREILRKVISKDLIPALHSSSYNAWNHIRGGNNSVIDGFIKQVEHVSVGIDAVLKRALNEGINLIVEGAHIVPTFVPEEYLRSPNVHIFVLSVADVNVHRNRFFLRAANTILRRPPERYIENFEAIREIQDYLLKCAKKYNIPVIDNVELKSTLTYILEAIVEKIKSKKLV